MCTRNVPTTDNRHITSEKLLLLQYWRTRERDESARITLSIARDCDEASAVRSAYTRVSVCIIKATPARINFNAAPAPPSLSHLPSITTHSAQRAQEKKRIRLCVCVCEMLTLFLSLAHKTRSFFFTRSSLSRLLLLLAIVRPPRRRSCTTTARSFCNQHRSFGGQCDLHCLLNGERPHIPTPTNQT
jgi:hypothetical protein